MPLTPALSGAEGIAITNNNKPMKSIKTEPTEQATKQLISNYFSQLGKKGGAKGGKALAASMTPLERVQKARKMVLAREIKAGRVCPHCERKYLSKNKEIGSPEHFAYFCSCDIK